MKISYHSQRIHLKNSLIFVTFTYLLSTHDDITKMDNACFHSNSYVIEVELQLSNRGVLPFHTPLFHSQRVRSSPPLKKVFNNYY
jgi:hypothetical protein